MQSNSKLPWPCAFIETYPDGPADLPPDVYGHAYESDDLPCMRGMLGSPNNACICVCVGGLIVI